MKKAEAWEKCNKTYHHDISTALEIQEKLEQKLEAIKKWWWVGAVVAILGALLKGRNPLQGRAEKAQDEALEAKHEAIDAKADAANERADHEAEVELGDLNGMSDDDLFRDALNRTRAERGGKG